MLFQLMMTKVPLVPSAQEGHDGPALRITPVWTPTDASWLNLIEARFDVHKRFTLSDTDDPTHPVRRDRIYRYLRYRKRTLNGPLTRLRSLRVLSWSRASEP